MAESVSPNLRPFEDSPPDVLLLIVRGPVLTSGVVTALPEWSAGWWEWTERKGFRPVLELGDVDCALGQEGNVCFLAGRIDDVPQMAAGTPAQPDITCCNDPPDAPPAGPVRRCSVPSTRTLLAPPFVINWHNDPGENLTIEEKRAWLDAVISDQVPGALNSQICGLRATLDGKVAPHQRLKSPPFPHKVDPQTIGDGFFVVRNHCALPRDKALFFPISNSWFFNDLGWSRERFLPTVVRHVDAVDQLTVTIDGVALTDHLLSHRADSGLFTLHLPEKGYYDTGPKACGPDHLNGDPSAAWAILTPSSTAIGSCLDR